MCDYTFTKLSTNYNGLLHVSIH